MKLFDTNIRRGPVITTVTAVVILGCLATFPSGVDADSVNGKGDKSLAPLSRRAPPRNNTEAIFRRRSTSQAQTASAHPLKSHPSTTGAPVAGAATVKRGFLNPLARRLARLRDGRPIKDGMADKTYDHKLDFAADWTLGAKLPQSQGGGAGGGGGLCVDCRVGEIGCDGTVEGELLDGDCRLGADNTLLDVWAFELEEGQRVSIDLSANFNTFMFITNAECVVLATNNDCVAADALSGSCVEIDLGPGLYYFIANGWVETDFGPYTLSVTCAPITTCEDCLAGEIACGESVSGELELPPSDCDLGDGTALDVWSFTMPESGRASITLDSPDQLIDPWLFVFGDDCIVTLANDDRLPGADPNSTIIADLEAGQYFIGVNSATAAQGSYDLAVSCQTGFDFCADCTAGPLTCEEAVEGELSKDDCLSPETLGSVDLHSFEVTETGRFTFTVSSGEFNPVLLGYDESCELLAANNDCSGGDLSTACITLDLEPGTYMIGTTSFVPNELGLYSLSVECSVGFDFCADCVKEPIDCDSTLTGLLDGESCVDDDGSFVDLFPFTLENDGPAVIELSSLEFDTFVWLYDENCAVVAFNDDIDYPENLNSRITIDLPAGSYSIGVSSWAPAAIGNYDVTLTCPDARLCTGCVVGEVTCDVPASGSLADGDCTLDDNSFIDLYSFNATAGLVLDVNVESETLDTVLVVLDSLCRIIATNDDCTPDQLVSCIEGLVIEPGEYFIGVAGLGEGEAGDYELRVGCEVFDPCRHCIAGSVICGDTVSGEITTEDCPLGATAFMDVWELTVDEPTALSVELASVEFDPLLFILDSNCVQIGAGDECAGGNPDGACASAWVTPGTYYVVATTVDDQGAGAYDLVIGCAPADQVCVDCEVSLIDCEEDIESIHPTAVDCVSPRGASLDIFSFVLEEDDFVIISILGDYDTYLHLLDADCIPIDENDDGGPGLNSLIARDLTAGTYFIGVSSFLPGQGGGFTISVRCGMVELCDDCVADDIECDGTFGGDFPQTECLSLRNVRIDLYRLEISEPSAVAIDLIGDSDPAQAYDAYLHLFNADCEQVAFDDDGGDGFNSRIGIDLAAGTYYVGASSFDAAGAGRLELSVACGEIEDTCGECRVSMISCGETVEGEHPQTACMSRRNQPMDNYTFEIRTAGEVTINLSAEWDTYLHLFDSDCVEIAFNDDIGGGNLNSSIFRQLDVGTYHIGVSRFNQSDGPMSLELLCDGANDCIDCAVGEIGPGEERSVDLGGSGCTEAAGGGFDVWTFDVPDGFSGTIDLAADAFDPTLTLLDSACEQIDFNDDANAGTLHSRLSVDLAPGVYSIQVKTVFPEESGPYVLTVSGGGGGGVGPFLRGDWDANGLVQLTDGVNVFNFLFLGGGPATCLAAADANGQGVINLSSGVYVLNFLFTGGPAPIAPFPTCGPGELPSDATLGCAEAHACE